MPTKLALTLLFSIPLFAQYSPPTGVGGTCAALAGDVSGTCAANTVTHVTTQSAGEATTLPASDAFVAAVVASINPAISVQAATIAVLSNTPAYSNGTAGVGATITASTNGALTVDAYTVLLGDRILVKNQASTFQNGVYTLTTLGDGSTHYVLTRATDYNASTNINYTGTIPVLNGGTLAATGWNGPTNIATVGTDAITYTQAAAANAGGPPGGNVKASGNLTAGNSLKGAGGKSLIDTGLVFGAVNLPTPGATCTFSTGATVCVCTTTCTVTVPVPSAGLQYCVMNDDNVATVITLSAIGSSSRYENQARTAYGTAATGTLVSAGAIKDFVCLLGRDSTHYLFASGGGTWTAN